MHFLGLARLRSPTFLLGWNSKKDQVRKHACLDFHLICSDLWRQHHFSTSFWVCIFFSGFECLIVEFWFSCGRYTELGRSRGSLAIHRLIRGWCAILMSWENNSWTHSPALHRCKGIGAPLLACYPPSLRSKVPLNQLWRQNRHILHVIEDLG